MRNRTVVAVAATVALAGAVAGCSASGAQPADTDELDIGNFLDVQGWDPAEGVIGFDGPYMSAVYDPLVRIDSEGVPQPALAVDWEYSDDRRTLTMDLRDDVTFSDGETFDADAAVVAIDHLRDGIMPGDTYSSVEDVQAVDEDTIELTLSKRDDSLLYLMGAGQSWMASPKAIDEDTLDAAPVGSGPYTLDEDRSTSGSAYTFVKTDDHWDSDLFPYETVTVRPISDPAARHNAMASGQVDVSYGMPEYLDSAQEQGWNVASSPGSWVGLQFADRTGDNEAAFGDERVRRAISLAFDGEDILTAIGDGSGEATNQIFPYDGDVHDDERAESSDADVDEAKRLLDEAGYGDGFSVQMPMAPSFQPWQAVVTENLKKIGISVEWDNMQMPDYQTNAATYPLFIAVINLDSDAATSVTRQVSTPQWFNPQAKESLEAHPEVKDLVDKANSVEGEDQLEAIRTLNETLTDKSWFDVWYQNENLYFSTPDVEVTPVVGLMFPTLNFIQPA